MLAVLAVGHGDVLQPHLGALGALDLGHDVIDAPAHHVLDRPALALADADDAVARLEPAVQRGRAAGDDLADHRHLVLPLQLRADAFQRQRHLLVEQVGGARGEVVGVRVDRAGVGVQVGLEHVLALELLHRGGDVGVALVQRGADVLGLLAGQLQAQPVVHHRLAPQVVQLRRGGPRRVLAVVLEALVAVEIEILLEQAARVADALEHALLVHREYLVGRVELAVAQVRADLRLERGEALHVGGGEILLAAVQRLQIALEHVGRQRRRHRARAVGIAAVGQQPVDQLAGGGLVGRRRHRGHPAVAARHQRQRRAGQHQGRHQGQQERGGLEFHAAARLRQYGSQAGTDCDHATVPEVAGTVTRGRVPSGYRLHVAAG